MVIYLDIAFLLNALADALALYGTARLTGLPVQKLRLAAAAALGGTYGAVCALPGLETAAGPLWQLAMAGALVYLAFGRCAAFLRRFLLFLLLSCTMGGLLLAAERLLAEGGAVLAELNWGVFLLAGGLCFLLLSVVFRGSARHAVEGQLRRCSVERRGRRADLTALLDTGHTLSDPCTGRPVLTAHWEALGPLWTEEERCILARLERDGAAACLERLGAGSGFRLLPYQAVGVSGGLLLCFRPEGASLSGKGLGEVTVALSPTAVSDGGGYAALWGGETEKEAGGYAA